MLISPICQDLNTYRHGDAVSFTELETVKGVIS